MGGGLASEQVPHAHRLAAMDVFGEQQRALPASTAARGDVFRVESLFLPVVLFLPICVSVLGPLCVPLV